MTKFKILDCDYGCGGFTAGLEKQGSFIVTDNASLTEENLLCYNSSHKNDFYIDKDFDDDIDLIHYTPDLGYNFSSRGNGKFDENEFNIMGVFLSIHQDVENILITLRRDTYLLMHNSKHVCYINGDIPVRDEIACFLDFLGYNVSCYVYDEANFGLPQHVFRVVYFASKNNVSLPPLNEKYGRFRKPYRTSLDFLHDLKDDSRLSWHDCDYSKMEVCSHILPGSNASKTDAVSQKKGYNRLGVGFLDKHLHHDFYTVSSSYPSIHPLYDRPLTIREGARLFGLSDNFTWDKNVINKNRVAHLIYDSFYPDLSELVGQSLVSVLK